MDEYNQICISRLDKMGDMILSLPIIKTIKLANPNTKIFVLASQNNVKVLKNLSYIDKIIQLISVVGMSLPSFFRLAFTLVKNLVWIILGEILGYSFARFLP